MRVITYIDGFNLYHSIKRAKCSEYLKWQDLTKLAQCFLAKNDKNVCVKNFAAPADHYPESKPRQQIYVDILQDLGVKVIWGHFKNKLVKCPKCQKTYPKPEEKQTDVNIAVHIVRDMYDFRPDVIQLISGDTDLVPPLKIAKELGAKIYVVAPINSFAKELRRVSDKFSKIKIKHLEKCFLGKEYAMKNGEIIKCPYALPIS